MCNNIKHFSYIYVIDFTKEERRENGTCVLFEKINAENLLNVVRHQPTDIRKLVNSNNTFKKQRKSQTKPRHNKIAKYHS